MKNFFKKAGITLLIIAGVFCILAILSIPVKKFNNDKKELELTNKILENDVNKLNSQLLIYEKEKASLLDQLSKKEIEIVEKEKIVYVDGELIVPEDYTELKENYSSLSELYVEKSSMYDLAKQQIDKDTIVINELTELNIRLTEQNSLLFDSLNKKEPFNQLIKGGVSTFNFTSLNYTVGYQVLIYEKISIEANLNFPTFSVGLLIGFKL